jgi:hypothetical protein
MDHRTTHATWVLEVERKRRGSETDAFCLLPLCLYHYRVCPRQQVPIDNRAPSGLEPIGRGGNPRMGDWHWILGLVLGSFGAFNVSDPLIMIVDHTRALFNPLLCVLHLPERFSLLDGLEKLSRYDFYETRGGCQRIDLAE